MADAPTADEPRADDEPRAVEPRAAESSPHETPELRRGHAESEPSPWEDWTESSAHGCVQGGDYSPDSYSEGEWVEGRKVYQRGRTKLPPTPATPDQRWLIAPNGENSWTHEDGVRRPNTILGVICRQCFPGWVTLPGEGRVPELGMTWEHYLAAPAPPEHRVGDVECDTVADIVIATFWTFYGCAEG
ncbi:hypothetical protein VPH35_073230 [Triticum aestivum]